MSISRRGFFGTAAGAGVLAASSTAKAGGLQHFTGYPEGYGLLHDTTLCVGCRACERSCTQVNKLPLPKTPLNNKSIFHSQHQ